MAARRALDLALIPRNAFFEFYRDHLAEAKRRTDATAGGGDFYLTQNVRLGRRFGVAVVHAVQEGRLTYREAYARSPDSGDTPFANYVAELQGGRRR